MADIQEVFETVDVLLGALGYPLFDPLVGGPAAERSTVFHCRRAGVDASGIYNDEGFVVFKNSVVRADFVPSAGEQVHRLRERLARELIIAERDGKLAFARDHLFESPSAAAAVVVAGRANGWIEWKDDQGRTLHEIYRAGE